VIDDKWIKATRSKRHQEFRKQHSPWEIRGEGRIERGKRKRVKEIFEGWEDVEETLGHCS
jgi:hypothetical protein